MKKTLLATTIWLFIFCHGLSEAGQVILAIQSIRVTPYEEAVEGFKSVCHSEVKRIVLSELVDGDVLKKVNRLKPDLILAIGVGALSKLKGVKDIPIVYLMVMNPRSILSGEENITGVSMNIPQEKQLLVFSNALPDIKRIGLLYDPYRSSHLVNMALNASKKIGVTLIAKETHSPMDVPSLIEDMKGKIDAYWMLPDIKVITPETVEFLLLFSVENKTPLLTFSGKYVESGALMSIGIDAFDIGSQAGEMAKKILSGMEVTSIQQAYARKLIILINFRTARKLGVTIDEEVVRNARIIN